MTFRFRLLSTYPFSAVCQQQAQQSQCQRFRKTQGFKLSPEKIRPTPGLLRIMRTGARPSWSLSKPPAARPRAAPQRPPKAPAGAAAGRGLASSAHVLVLEPETLRPHVAKRTVQLWLRVLRREAGLCQGGGRGGQRHHEGPNRREVGGPGPEGGVGRRPSRG